MLKKFRTCPRLSSFKKIQTKFRHDRKNLDKIQTNLEHPIIQTNLVKIQTNLEHPGSLMPSGRSALLGRAGPAPPALRGQCGPFGAGGRTGPWECGIGTRLLNPPASFRAQNPGRRWDLQAGCRATGLQRVPNWNLPAADGISCRISCRK